MILVVIFVKIMIDGREYVMPMGELNKELLADIVSCDTIDMDNLDVDIEKQYQKSKRVFDLLCHSVMMFADDSETTLQAGVKKICGDMWRVDNLIIFYAKNKQYDKAIYYMKEFMVSMLEPFQNIYEKRQVK